MIKTLKKVLPTTASRDSLLAVMLNPLRLPEWSLFIKSVQAQPGSYVAQTLSGPLEFYWYVDRQNDRAIMQFDLNGVPVEATFFLYEQDGVRYVGEEFSVNETDRADLKRVIRTAKKEPAMLRALIEHEERASPYAINNTQGFQAGTKERTAASVASKS